MKVPGARIMVVGGVRRLGRTLALDLARSGAAVCVSTHTAGPEAEGQRTALRAAHAPDAAVVVGDVRTAAGAADLVAAGAAALGGLDALVFAASGPFVPSPPESISEASWDASFDTIAKGFFFAATAARGLMLAGETRDDEAARHGVIIAITDQLGIRPWAAFAAHGAAKAAQIHLVAELASAWSSDGIRVCGIAPGPVALDDDEHPAATLRAAGGEVEWLVPPAKVAAAVRHCLETDMLTGTNTIVDQGASETDRPPRRPPRA